ncbi:MAG: hypothetical protein JXB03_11430 [Spirochaetales bacterium]|nr:hypothetical protein [Spirochaetales bacterium]
MTDVQWDTLKAVINGETVKPRPVGFIIDSPWLPNWYGVNILDYYTNDEIWLDANFKAIETFPDVMFLPGFWSEYGMCTEPSAYGARSNFPLNDFPHAHKVIASTDDILSLPQPNPAIDGMLPFILNRLKLAQQKIEAKGQRIRFAVARGPLNIASFLMGTSEFLMAMMLEPDKTHALMKNITRFLKDWIDLQRSTFPSIDGILLLDDIIGFIGEPEFRTFGLPYFQELYSADVSVKFLHNDAPCKVSAPILPEMGVNLFNMGFDVTLAELKEMTGNKITLLGNIPPRDVLAGGSPEDVQKAAGQLIDSLPETSRVIFSCGGGMPPQVPTENIHVFTQAVQSHP